MAKFWRSSQFKDLEKEWEQRLAESGFKDAEKPIAGERVLRQSASYAFRRREHDETYREAKLEYFSLLAKHIHEEFKDYYSEQPSIPGFDEHPNLSPDRLIMERTAEGKTIQEISRELKALGLHKHNRDTIRYIRRRYENKWGIKSWQPRDMVSRKVAPTPSSPSQPTLFPINTKASLRRSGSGR